VLLPPLLLLLLLLFERSSGSHSELRHLPGRHCVVKGCICCQTSCAMLLLLLPFSVLLIQRPVL
jgi:hypothetical protein